MASRYYRDRLHAVLTSANDESIDTSATDWSTNAFLLQGVAVGIRASSATLGSEIEGNTGRAMVAHFKAISDKLEQDSADIAKEPAHSAWPTPARSRPSRPATGSCSPAR